MAQYIDKSALVAEIERRIKGLKDCHADTIASYAGEISGLKRLLSFLDTLKVEELWKPADGNDLPEIDREIIVLTQSYPLEGNEYAVYFAHRPNPNGWDGKNIATGEIEHYTPKTYDNGGWNQPNVKWWLDLDLPKMKE